MRYFVKVDESGNIIHGLAINTIKVSVNYPFEVSEEIFNNQLNYIYENENWIEKD